MLTAKKRAEIIAALEANPNATAIARKISGVSVAGVWKIAKRAGIELTAGKAARHQLPAEKRAEIVAALNVSHNAARVAREVGGISPVGVWKIAQAEGIELARSSVDRARRKREANQYLVGGGLARFAAKVA